MREMTKESIRNQRVLIKTWEQIKECSTRSTDCDILNNRLHKHDKYEFVEQMKPLCGTIIKLQGVRYLGLEMSYGVAPWMVQEIIPTQEKVEFYDKQPIYFWDDWKTHEKHLGFWDGQRLCSFRSNGTRTGHNWDNYEAVLDNQIPSWMVEAQETLKD